MKNVWKWCSMFAATFTAIALNSCGKEDISGVWSGNQESLGYIEGVADASSVMTLEFLPPEGDNPGKVTITALINANQPVAQDSTMIAPYEVSVAATASIEGTWTYEKGEDDDVVISFDPATYKLNIDPEGVAMSENMFTGRQQPEIDSLTSITVNAWKNVLGKPVRDAFNSFQKISDIKIHKNILSCEVSDHDVNFRKVTAQ